MRFFASVLIFVLTGCSSVQWVDRSRLNHPAMVLTEETTPARASFLTNLDSITETNGGGGCAVCAH